MSARDTPHLLCHLRTLVASERRRNARPARRVDVQTRTLAGKGLDDGLNVRLAY